jgi:hypothetical protein
MSAAWLLVYAPGARFVVEGVRDADGTFRVTALFRRVPAPVVDIEPPQPGEPMMLLTGPEAERTVARIEDWLAERQH